MKTLPLVGVAIALLLNVAWIAFIVWAIYTLVTAVAR